MMQRFKLYFIIILLFTGLAAKKASAQSGIDLRINEFLVMNNANYVDDFGIHSSWIEIFNTAYNSVNIGGMYLTNDLKNPKKYFIPKGDPRTLIAPRSYIVFWADDNTTRGILHLNFDLHSSKVIALFDANGRELVDKVSIPEKQSADVSYGRITDGNPKWGYMEKTTPAANNNTTPVISSAEKFGEMDPFGGAMTVIAMSVVFISLALLYFIFKYVAKVYTLDVRKYFRKHKHVVIEELPVVIEDVSGEVNAAIAMALYLYSSSELHDVEDTVLTIKKVSRTYSPWSSKIHGLRKSPR